MTPINNENLADTKGEVDFNDTLESVIEKSNGDVSHSYIVMQENVPVGILNMSNLVKALVPRVASEEGARKYWYWKGIRSDIFRRPVFQIPPNKGSGSAK